MFKVNNKKNDSLYYSNFEDPQSIHEIFRGNAKKLQKNWVHIYINIHIYLIYMLYIYIYIYIYHLNIYMLKLVSAIFSEIFIFHQTIALQKP